MQRSRSLSVRLGRSAARILAGVLALIALFVLMIWLWMIRMPGCSHAGSLPALSEAEQSLAAHLRKDVETLAAEIGERNLAHEQNLQRAATHIEAAFQSAAYQVKRQDYKVGDQTASNLIAELKGTSQPEQIVVVGAHYDTAWGSPGADDNASAVAGLLALARALAKTPGKRTLRFVAFTNEEPPHFQKESMGSLVHARSCAEAGEKVVAMLALEMLGNYTDAPDSQAYPFPLSVFYPSSGNFIAFVGDTSSRALVHEVTEDFRSHTSFPSEGAALIGALPGIGYSDHWSFWQIGVPAIMVTDTAFFRYQHYHETTDTPDRLDYERMARVVAGIERVLIHLANTDATWD